MTQATLSASQSGIGFKRARDIAALAHLGALIAAKPRIHNMMRDAVLAGLLPEQLLEPRLSDVIELPPLPHTSVHLTVTSKRQQDCSSRKPHRLRTSLGNTLSRGCRPGVAGPTIASLGHPASQDDDSDTWTSQCLARAVSVATAPSAALTTH